MEPRDADLGSRGAPKPYKNICFFVALQTSATYTVDGGLRLGFACSVLCLRMNLHSSSSSPLVGDPAECPNIHVRGVCDCLRPHSKGRGSLRATQLNFRTPAVQPHPLPLPLDKTTPPPSPASGVGGIDRGGGGGGFINQVMGLLQTLRGYRRTPSNSGV